MDVGHLNCLPLELLQSMVLQLDLMSALRFRQTSARAREVVDSMYQYRAAVPHGLNAFDALIRFELAATISLLDFHL
jgi:hypothetical protein